MRRITAAALPSERYLAPTTVVYGCLSLCAMWWKNYDDAHTVDNEPGTGWTVLRELYEAWAHE